ncbi:MAG: transcriptional regulator, partial [Paracoccaceae bacterium]
MTGGAIEEIYLLVEAALQSGQPSVPVQAFPFRMTSERLSAETEKQWFDSLMNLKTGYDRFQIIGVPPSVTVLDQAYV